MNWSVIPIPSAEELCFGSSALPMSWSEGETSKPRSDSFAALVRPFLLLVGVVLILAS